METRPKPKVIVIGDLMVDYYRNLQPLKVSPEAPVIIFTDLKQEYRMGGAANVLSNVYSLGIRDCALVCVVGHDWHTKRFDEKCELQIYHYLDLERETMVKERLVEGRHQIARIDSKKKGYVNKDGEKVLLDISLKLIRGNENCKVVVFSDYAHGALPPSLCQAVIAECRKRKIKVVVDTKAKDSMTKYKGATIILPNISEALDISGYKKKDDIKGLSTFLRKKMKLEYTGITMGDKGIYLQGGMSGGLIESLPIGQSAIDATGAGDVVTASVARCLACGMGMGNSIQFANVAAGISVTKWGTNAISLDEVEDMMAKMTSARMKKTGEDHGKED